MIKYIDGDLFDNDLKLEAIGHGVNTLGVMGAGIAITFRDAYPRMFDIYRNMCRDSNSQFLLGKVFFWEVLPSEKGAPKYILNMFTQGKNEQGYIGKALINDVKTTLIKAREICELDLINSLGLPRVGSGLGGLEWKEVRETINEVWSDCKTNLYVFENYVPRRG